MLLSTMLRSLLPRSLRNRIGRCTPRRRTRIQTAVETLEDRVVPTSESLLSPGLMALAQQLEEGGQPEPLAVLPLNEISAPLLEGVGVDSAAGATQAAANVREVVFLDAAVVESDELIGALHPHATVVHLAAHRDGVKQMAEFLGGHMGVSEVHVISHGGPGAVQLGSVTLDAMNLDRYASEFATIKGALSEEADLLIYGCDVAAGMAGVSFLARLSQVTGADVAASTDVTGSAEHGGNWKLEEQAGAIEAAAIGNKGETATIGHLLQLPPTTVHVNDNWPVQIPGEDPDGAGVGVTAIYGYDAFDTIQEGIAAVADQGTVNVLAGTYVEAIDILDKSLTLAGDGEATTVIQAPSSIPRTFEFTNWNGVWNLTPIVYVHATTPGHSVTIRNLSVDGDHQVSGLGSSRFVGIAYDDVGGLVQNVEIRNVRASVLDGGSHFGLLARGFDNDLSLELNNLNVHDYGKCGVLLTAFGATAGGLDVYMHDSVVTGAGATPALAQNGIEIDDGATGRFVNNTISALGWIGSGWTATAFAALDSGKVVLRNNTIRDAQSGIALWNFVSPTVDATLGGNQVLASSLVGPTPDAALIFANVDPAGIKFEAGNLLEGTGHTWGLYLESVGGGVLDLDALAFQGFTDSGQEYIHLSNSPTAVDAMGATFEGKSGAQMTHEELLAVEKRIWHAPDAAGLGLVRVSSGEVFVNAGGNLQAAVDSASDGDTILVAPGEYDGIVVNSDKTLTIEGLAPGVVIKGASPALTINAGDVSVQNGIVFETSTDAPTILVQGGDLTLRACTVRESNDFEQAAIRVTSGNLDLGTDAVMDPGSNFLEVRGAGVAIDNQDADPIAALGNTFRLDAVDVISGFRIEDLVHHKLDTDLVLADTGLVRWVADNVYVTAPATGSTDSSIQRGVYAASEGDTVNVEDGLYLESDITIQKGLRVIGQSEIGVIVAPAVLDGQEDDSWTDAHYAFLLRSGDVTISNLTIDGQGNTALGSANNYRGGVMTDHRLNTPFDNITVQDITIQNTYRRGIQIFPGTAALRRSTGHLIDGNTISNVTYGPAIVFFDAEGTISNNEISGTPSAIESVEWSQSGGAAVTISGNTIHHLTASPYGVGATGIQVVEPAAGTLLSDNHIDLTLGSTLPDVGIIVRNATGSVTVQNNEITAEGKDAGLWLFGNAVPVQVALNTLTSSGSAASALGEGRGVFLSDDGSLFTDGNGNPVANLPGSAVLTDNQISGFALGVDVASTGGGSDGGKAVSAVIGELGHGNTISGAAIGVRVYNAPSVTGASASAEIEYNTIAGPGAPGIGVQVEGSAASADIDSNLIHSCGIGIELVNGGYATEIDNNDFGSAAGDPDNGIGLMLDRTAGLVPGGYVLHGNLFAGSTHTIDNESPNAVSVLLSDGNSFVDGTGAAVTNNFRIEDGILHKMDDPSYGLITWVAANVYVTTAGTDHSIQRGIDAASDGDTVNVEAGTYAETVHVNKRVTLLGATHDAAIPEAGRSDEAVIDSSDPLGAVQILTDHVSVNGFKIINAVYGVIALEDSHDITVRYTHIVGSADTMIDGINLWRGGANAVVSYNRIENGTVTGISGGDDRSTPSLGDDLPLSALIEHNTIVNTKYGITGYHSGSTIQSNIVVGNGVANAAGISGQFRSANVLNNEVSGYTQGAGIALAPYEYGTRPRSSEVTLTGNILTGNAAGFFVAQDVVGADIDFHGNTITTLGGYAVVHAGTGELNLTTGNTIDLTDSTSTALSDQFALADRILDAVDGQYASTGTAGLVRLVVDNVYVTPNSYNLLMGTAAPSIQRAINAADPGDTVNVEDGLYRESDITIQKGLRVIGQSEVGVIVAPAVPDGQVDDSWTDAHYAFLLRSGDVTISNLTIDGQGNSALGSANNYRGGVMTDHRLNTPFDNITVQDVTIQNTYRRGIQIFPGTAAARRSTGHLIDGNTISNVTYGPAIVFFDAEGTISNNEISGTPSAIESVEWSQSGGAAVTISGNTIHHLTASPYGSGATGIQVVEPAAGTLLSDNHINLTLGSTMPDVGIIVRNATGSVTVQNNEITAEGKDAGLWLFGNAVPVQVALNTLTSSGSTAAALGEGRGVFLSDDGSLFTDGNGDPVDNLPGSAVLTDNTISNFAIGVDVSSTGGGDGEGQTVSAVIGEEGHGNTISGGEIGLRVSSNAAKAGTLASAEVEYNTLVGPGAPSIGVQVEGGHSSAEVDDNLIHSWGIGIELVNGGVATSIDDNDLGSAPSDPDNGIGLMLDQSAGLVPGGYVLHGNLFAGSTYAINNESSNAVSVLLADGNSFFDGAGMAVSNNFRIEDSILHKMDDPLYGLVTWVAGNVYVTDAGTDHDIQRGITIAGTGDTVNIESGSYAESVTTGVKEVTLAAAGQVVLTGGLTLDSHATMAFDIAGPLAGTDYDQWVIPGSATLGGATLAVDVTYTPALGARFTLLDTAGGSGGAFAGLPDNTVQELDGIPFWVDYQGGDGRDFTLLRDQPPVANAGGPYTTSEGQTLTLDASATTDPDEALGDVLIYTWYVDNRYAGTGETLSLDWEELKALGVTDDNLPWSNMPQGHWVILSVTDESGLSSGAYADLYVCNTPPEFDLTGAATVAEASPYELTLGSVVDPGDDTVQMYRIFWGDGEMETFYGTPPATQTHTYADGPNPYTISVDATDEDGTFLVGTKLVTVLNVAPTIAISGAASVNEGATYTLNLGTITNIGDDIVTGGIIHWGDGASTAFTPTDASKTHVYADGLNTYAITVDLIDEDGTHADRATPAPFTVEVRDVAPTVGGVAVTSTVSENGVATLSGTIGGAASDTFTLTINWGDGSTPETFTYAAGTTSFSETHRYLDDNPSGTLSDGYTISGILADDDGGSAPLAPIVTVVKNTAPVFDSLLATSVVEGGLVHLTGTYHDAGSLDTHRLEISWGDGSDSEYVTVSGGAFDFTHQYLDDTDLAGIWVKLTDDDGGETNRSIDVSVSNAVPMVYAGGYATIHEGETFSRTGYFTDPGSGPKERWEARVDYGDGSGEQLLPLNPDRTFDLSHVYADTGIYHVRVMVHDDDMGNDEWSDSFFDVFVANVAPVVAVNSDVTDLDEAQEVHFSASVTESGHDALGYLWDFGDGQTSTLQNPTHTYADNGDYTARCTVTDADGAVGTDALLISVANVQPLITEENLTHPAPLEEGDEVRYSMSFEDAGLLDGHTVQIDWGDESLPVVVHLPAGVLTTGELYHTYRDNGTYLITPIVSDDDGGLDTLPPNLCTEVTVLNVRPSIAVSGSAMVSEGAVYTLTLGPISDPGTDTVTGGVVYWGDGNSTPFTAGMSQVTHVYDGVQTDRTIRVNLTDEDGLHTDRGNLLTVHVENVAPTAPDALGPVTVTENVAGVAVGLTAHSTDPGGDSIRYILTDDPGGLFVIDPGSGVIRLADGRSLDYEAATSHSIKVAASDSDGGRSNETTFTIHVGDVNEAPTVSLINRLPEVREDATLPLKVADIVVSDDALGDETLTLSGLDASLFEIIGNELHLRAGAALDFETNPVLHVTVEVDDPALGATFEDSDSMSLAVTDVNEPPTLNIPEGYSHNVDEESVLAFTAVAGDPDLPPQFLTFSLIGAPAGATLVPRAVDPRIADFHWTPTEAQGPGSYTFWVRVSDGMETAEREVHVSVREVNQNPTLTLPSGPLTVTEGELIAFMATGLDSDLPAQLLTYSLISGPAGAFVDPMSGRFSWTPGESDGVAGGSNHNVKIRVTDALGRYDEEALTITVNEANIPPVLAYIPPQSVAEGLELSLAIRPFASDADLPANALAFSLQGDRHGATIDATTGLFLWTPTEAQGPGSYTFTVRVTDASGLYDERMLLVSVGELNEAPTLTLPVLPPSIAEGQTLAFTATAADVDVPAGMLRFSLIDAPLGAVIDPVSGAFTWTPGEGHGGSSWSFTIRVTDPAGAFNEEVVTVAVTEVNAPPVLTGVPVSRTAAEMTPIVFQATANDPDTPPAGLHYYLIGAPAGAMINPDTGQFSWTPSEVQGPGSYTFEVAVSDDQGLNDRRTMSVAVTEANRPPALTPAGPFSIPEGEKLVFHVSANDPDLPTQDLIFALSGTQAGVVFDPLTGRFEWTPSDLQGPGDYSFSVTARDSDGALSDPAAILVHVGESNRPPILNPLADQIVPEGAACTFTASALDPDHPAQTLTFALDGAPLGASIDPNTGVFTWTPGETQGPGVFDFSVIVRDTEGLEDRQSVRISVTEVDSPTDAFQDAFARPDSGDVGAPWRERLGDYGLAAQRLTGQAGSLALATVDGLWAADVSVQAEVTLSQGRLVGVVARCSGSDDRNTYWAGLVNWGKGPAVEIWKNTNGLWTKLGHKAVGKTSGVIRLDVTGTQLRLFLNSKQKLRVVDSTPLGAGYVGVRSEGGVIDNFAAVKLLPAPLPFLDQFERPGALLPGAYWTQSKGGFDLQSGQLYAATTSMSMMALNTANLTNVRLEAQVSVAAAPTSTVSLMARYGSVTGNMYVGQLELTAQGYKASILAKIGGLWYVLGSSAVDTGTGRLRFEVLGDRLQLYFNDVLVVQGRDGRLSSGQVGIRGKGSALADFAATVL